MATVEFYIVALRDNVGANAPRRPQIVALRDNVGANAPRQRQIVALRDNYLRPQASILRWNSFGEQPLKRLNIL